MLLEHRAQVDGRPYEADPANTTNSKVLEAPRIRAPLVLTRRCRYPRPIIQVLIQYGADLCVRTGGETLFHQGAAIGNPSILLALLNASMYVNVKETTFGDTALHRGSLEGQKGCYRSFRDVDVRSKNNFGRDPIQHAHTYTNEEAANSPEQALISRIDQKSLGGPIWHSHNEEQLLENTSFQMEPKTRNT